MKTNIPTNPPLRVLSILLLCAVVAALSQAGRAQTTLTPLVNFTNTNGGNPAAGLIQGNDGNFYGTTEGGGSTFLGTVFRLTPGGDLTTLASFGSASDDGYYPNADLIAGRDGNFHGTTPFGGESGAGTVFRVTPAGTLTTLVSFVNASLVDGSGPQGGVIQGSDGNFYGTTYRGGSSGYGIAYQLTSAGVVTILANFTHADGSPKAGLIQASDGNFYGTTYDGGTHTDANHPYGNGTVFRLTPAGALTTLVSFAGANGSYPVARLIQGSDGNFYGTTNKGGSGDRGTVFRLTPAGVLTTLVNFTGPNGLEPLAGLIQGSDGNFYGTTEAGGSGQGGTVFRMTPAGALTTLVNFTYDGATGSFPQGGLIQGNDGNFYGTTAGGGTKGYGTVFRLSVGGVVPPAPSITSALTATGTQGTAFSYQMTATHSPTSYSATGLPAGLSINAASGLISGIPTVSGALSVTLSATNANATGTATLALTVISNNANLASLVPSAGALSPPFAIATRSYTDSVPIATTSMTVTPTVAQANAKVKVNGVTVPSGSASGPISLNIGSNNIITTVVTAQDGTTKKTYTLTVSRVGPPVVATLAASAVVFNGATLNGTVNPNGLVTTAHFEYGLTSAYGTATANQNVAAGNSVVPVHAAIGNLRPNTTYHYRAVATNSKGTARGPDRTFTTLDYAVVGTWAERTVVRTLPAAIGSKVDIGTLVFTGGTGSIDAAVNATGPGWSVAKRYVIPIRHNLGNGSPPATWLKVLPTHDTGPYGVNDFDLDVNVTDATVLLRLRTAASNGNAATAKIALKTVGLQTFVNSSATAAAAAPAQTVVANAVDELNGKAGIGVAPSGNAAIDVNGGDTRGLRLRPRSPPGAPATGAWNKGTIILDSGANLYICTASGTPGTWKKVGAP